MEFRWSIIVPCSEYHGHYVPVTHRPQPIFLSYQIYSHKMYFATHDTETRRAGRDWQPFLRRGLIDRALTIGPVNAEVLVYRGNSARKGIKGAVSESLTRANLRFNKIIAVGDRRKNVLKQVSGIAGVGAVSISTFASLASTCPVYFLISGPSACPLKRHISPA